MNRAIRSVLAVAALVVLIAGLVLAANGLRPAPGAAPGPAAASTALPAATTAFAPGEIHRILPSGLRIEEYALAGPPGIEPLTFTTLDGAQPDVFFLPSGRLNTHAGQSFDAAGLLTSSVMVGNDKISVTQGEGDGTGHGVVVQVARNGQAVDTIPAGDNSPLDTLHGLWAYDGHWALEIAYVTNRVGADNSIFSDAVGQVYLDGELLNGRKAYQEAFGFQTLNGRPFYFFKRDGRIDIAFEGQEIRLGYESIPHYGCCSAAEQNPRSYMDGVTFFAQRNGIQYYVAIGVSATPAATPAAPTVQPTSTPGALLDAYAVVADGQSEANLRSGPGTTYPVVGTLKMGESARALGRTDGGEWVKVALPQPVDGTAWVYAALVSLSGGPLPVLSGGSAAPPQAASPAALEAIRQFSGQDATQAVYEGQDPVDPSMPGAVWGHYTLNGATYGVDPLTNRVVRFEAASEKAPGPRAYTPDELKQIAVQFVKAHAPEVQLQALFFVLGNKGNYYFFRWSTAPTGPGYLAYVQVGYQPNGYLFQYINTLPSGDSPIQEMAPAK